MCTIYAINPLFYCKILGLCKRKKISATTHAQRIHHSSKHEYTETLVSYKQKRILFALRANMVLCCSDISLVIFAVLCLHTKI